MPKTKPVLSADAFLSNAMESESKAQLNEFAQLWKHSESIRPLIKQAVLTSQTEAIDETACRAVRCGKSRQRQIEAYAAPQALEDISIDSQIVGERLSRMHGGLSKKELLALLEKRKAGKLDLGTYMLVRAWKKSISANKVESVRLKRLTIESFRHAVTENRSDFFQQIADTIKFLQDEEYYDQGSWNHDPGHWWQFHLLLYILEYPKFSYKMREFVKHFKEEVGTREMPTTKTLRRFCRNHGIKLDSTPGAPKKANSKSNNPQSEQL